MNIFTSLAVYHYRATGDDSLRLSHHLIRLILSCITPHNTKYQKYCMEHGFDLPKFKILTFSPYFQALYITHNPLDLEARQ